MKIDALSPLNFVPTQVSTVARSWVIGQLLNIVVIGQRDQNSILVRVGNDTIAAESAIAVPPGTRFTARVVAIEPLPVLTPVKAATPAPTPPLQAAWLSALPKQAPLASSLHAADVLLTQAGTPDAVRPLAHTEFYALLQALPELATLRSPPLLKEALLNSGLGLEAKLASASTIHYPAAPPPTADLKWQLLAVLAQFTATVATPDAALPREALSHAKAVPPMASDLAAANSLSAGNPTVHRELIEQLEHALANITARQLQTAEASDAGHPFAVFEIPLQVERQPATVMVQYEERRSTSDTPPSAFTVQLRVPISATRELRARVTLIDHTLSATLWSPDPDVRVALTDRLQDLRTQLLGQHLQVGNLAVAEIDEIAPLARPNQQVLDVEA